MSKPISIVPIFLILSLLSCSEQEEKQFPGTLVGLVRVYGPCDFTTVDGSGVTVTLTESGSSVLVKVANTDDPACVLRIYLNGI